MSASSGRSEEPFYQAIADIRDRVPLASLVGRRVKLERSGRDWKGCCPFHGEKTPSFYVFPKDNHYHCFGCGAHGDQIGFVRKIEGLSFVEAVQRLADEAGIVVPGTKTDTDSAKRQAEAQRQRDRVARDRQRAEARERARKVAWGQRTAAELKPASERATRAYLRIDRVIAAEAEYPPCIGFHPDHHALTCIAENRDTGEVTGGQHVHLDADGHKLTEKQAKARGFKAVKETFGLVRGSVGHMPARVPSWRCHGLPVLLLVEGIETACTAWQMTGQETDVTFGVGNLRHAFRRDRANLVCLDDDRRGSGSWQQAQKAIRQGRADGFVVLTVSPWDVRRNDGSDLNDILRQSGPEGPDMVLERLRMAIDPGFAKPRRVSLAEAEKRLDSVFDAFVSTAIEDLIANRDDTEVERPALAWGVKSSTGVGKSVKLRARLAETVRRLRAASIGGPVVIAVPRHALAEEAADKMREVAPDLVVRVWKGRAQPGMCGEPERPARARKRLLDVQRFACETCPLFASCAYQKQRHEHADVWFVQHAMLTQMPPRAMSKPALLWVDETPVGAVLLGLDDNDSPRMGLDVLRRFDPIKGKPDAADRLRDLRGLAHAALAEMEPGPLAAAPFHRVGLTAAMADEAHKLEWMTKVEPDEPDEFACANVNLDLAARTRFWVAIGALLASKSGRASGWARLAATPSDDGGTEMMIRLRGRWSIHAAWRVATILTDASLQPELTEYLWPKLKLVADIEVETPHQHITQVFDKSWGLSSLDPDDPRIADPGPDAPRKLRVDRARERRRRARCVREVWVKLHNEARLAAPRKLLAAAQLRVIAQLEKLGPLPGNVVWMHHGAVTGIDRFTVKEDMAEDEKLGRIVVVGRAAPAPAAVEAMREALTGEVGEKVAPGAWYQRVDATHELADGRLVQCERDRHPDALAEAFRRRVTEFELQQIIGRGRGLRRTADDPLPVLVMTDVPLDLPVRDLKIATAEAVTFEDRRSSAGGVSTNCAAWAARLYPELWDNAAQAQYAQRQTGGAQPAGTVAYRAQLVGQGEKVWRVCAPVAMPADAVRAFFIVRFGALVVFDLWEVQPKGESISPQEDDPQGKSMYFPPDWTPPRPVAFGWSVTWGQTGPPDG